MYQKTRDEKYLNLIRDYYSETIEKCKVLYALDDNQVDKTIFILCSRMDVQQGYAFSTLLKYYLREPSKLESYQPQVLDIQPY